MSSQFRGIDLVNMPRTPQTHQRHLQGKYRRAFHNIKPEQVAMKHSHLTFGTFTLKPRIKTCLKQWISLHKEQSPRKLRTISSLPKYKYRPAGRSLAMLCINTKGCFQNNKRSGYKRKMSVPWLQNRLIYFFWLWNIHSFKTIKCVTCRGHHTPNLDLVFFFPVFLLCISDTYDFVLNAIMD